MFNNTVKIAAISGCRIILTCLSFVLTITLFLPMFFADSVSWLHSENAKDIFKSFIEQQAKERGYHINIKGLDYNLAEGHVYVDSVGVSYASKMLLQMRSVTLNLSVGSLVFGEVNAVAVINDLIIENYTDPSLPYVFNNVRIDTRADFADIMSGKIEFKAVYKKRGIGISTNFFIEENLLKLSSMAVYAPDFKGQGSVNILLNNNLVRGKFSGTLNEVSFYEHFVGVGHDLQDAAFKLSFSSTLGKQNILVEARAKSYENKEYSMSMNKIILNATLLGNKLQIDSFSALNGAGGDVKVSGIYNLINSMVDLSLKVDDFYISHMDMAKGIVNADLNFKGKGDNFLLSGGVIVDNMNIELPNKFSQAIPELNIETVEISSDDKAQNAAHVIVLNIDVDAPKQIFVRGWGMDAEFGGKVKVHGNLSKPKFDGAINLKRGRYEEFGKKFKISKASLNFSGTIPPSPKFDILAETKTSKILAKVGIKGNALSPIIEFSSVPPLPEDEVLAHILFGEDIENISPFQSIKLAQTLQRFTGGGGGASGFDPVELLRTTTGLDDLRFDTDKDGNASIGAGKHLSDKVYVEVEAGSETGSGQANIQIEITPHITLESEIGQNAQGGAGIFWKWDY